MYTEIVSLSAPDSISPGGTVNVEVMVRNTYTDNLHIYCVGVLNGGVRFIDYQEAWIMPYEAKVFSGSFTMPGEDASIGVYIYYVGVDGNLYPDTEVTKQIAVVGGQVEKWWITVAEGNTLSALEATATDTHIHGPFRVVVTANYAPDWVMQSAAWLYNDLRVPLNAIGVGLVGVRAEGNKIYIDMHGSPFAIIPIILAIKPVLITLAAILAGVGIVMALSDWKVQQEITKQLAIKLEIAKTTQEVTEAAMAAGFPPEVVATITKAMADLGSTPESDTGKIDWEAYLRWALIGGGVIVGTYLLLPMVVNLRKK